MVIASASPGMGAVIDDLGIDLRTANHTPNAGLPIVGRVNDLAYGNVRTAAGTNAAPAARRRPARLRRPRPQRRTRGGRARPQHHGTTAA